MSTYLTTPIYYASGSPHLGHAYTTFVADCYKRYLRLTGHEVYLTTGTDEHGQKIERSAAHAGQPVQAFVDQRSRGFSDLWQALDIDVDYFARTSSQDHHAFVTSFWQRLAAAGDLYKGQYQGSYCVDCEQYYTDLDACPVHERALEIFTEPSWFFRLSRYQEKLIHLLESQPDFITPAARRNEVLAFLRSGPLRDLSVSRVSTSWGVSVPGDRDHVVYVWVDALTSYLSVLGAFGSEALSERWQNTIHFIGKDILIFHAVYWPALLWSAGLPLPDRLIVNGWLTVEGRKIAKSNPETIIDPVALTQQFGVDGVKYYFARAVKLGSDLDYQSAQLVELLNSDLSNNIGNLFSRFIGLFHRHFPDGIEVPTLDCHFTVGERLKTVRDEIPGWQSALESADLAGASQTVLAIARYLNADIQQQAPWQWQQEPLAGYLWELHQCLRILGVLISCLTPELSQRALAQLGVHGDQEFSSLADDQNAVRVYPGEPLFARLAPGS